MRKNRNGFVPVVLLFIILNVLLITGNQWLEAWGADRDVLIGGNVLLFAITCLSYFIGIRGMNSPNPHAFVRSVYGSIMIKLFICIIAAFIYIATMKKDVNKPALFSLMGLYLVYTFLEVSLLMKRLRKKTNG